MYLIYVGDPLGTPNSDGVETWETVWGSSNGTTPYDWEPHTTDVIQNNVYASRWPLWTLVN